MHLDAAADPSAPLLVFGHGAGAGRAHPWIRRLAQGLATRGVHVVTFDFPYMAAGRGRPDPPATLEAAFAEVWREVASGRAIDLRPGRLFAGGKSMGGRIASQTAAAGGLDPAPAGLVFFGYPLHPPNAPGQRRDRHLPAIAAPMLFLHGTRDPFGSPDEMTALVAGLPSAQLELVTGGDHSLVRPKRQDAAGSGFDGILAFAAGWLRQAAKPAAEERP